MQLEEKQQTSQPDSDLVENYLTSNSKQLKLTC